MRNGSAGDAVDRTHKGWSKNTYYVGQLLQRAGYTRPQCVQKEKPAIAHRPCLIPSPFESCRELEAGHEKHRGKSQREDVGEDSNI